MKRSMVAWILGASLAVTAVMPVLAEGTAEGRKIAIITKSAGNPYNEKEAQGFQEVVEAEGGEAIVQHPETTTADAQIVGTAVMLLLGSVIVDGWQRLIASTSLWILAS